jgi:hypothetical protein
VVIERQERPRGKQAMDRVQQELVASSVIGPRSAFDLRSVAQVSAAVLVGIFLIAFLLAFLPWLLAGAMTAAVENLMRQVGFSKFTASNVGDWVIVFLVGLVAITFFVVVVIALAGVANFLAARVTFRRFRRAALRANTEMGFDDREPTAPLDASVRSSRPYEQRPVSELQIEAQRRGIPGRSKMNKAQLVDALRRGRH